MKPTFRLAVACRILAFWCLATAFPLAAQVTNNLLFQFSSFGQTIPVYSVHLRAVTPAVINGVFYANPRNDYSAVAYPSITNGYLVVSNQIAGVVMEATLSGYDDWTTNYCIPANAPTNSAGQVVAGNWVGALGSFGGNPQFAWTSPYITNYYVTTNGASTPNAAVTNNNGFQIWSGAQFFTNVNNTYVGATYWIGGIPTPLADILQIYYPSSGQVLASAGAVFAPNGQAIMDQLGNYGKGLGSAITNKYGMSMDQLLATNGNGGGLTNLNASAVSSGTLPLSQLPGGVVTNTYNLRAYGAYGDAQTSYGALALSNSTTVTVTGGAFVAGDVGKFIDIKGADVNRRDWWTTITTVNSPTSITVASAVPTSYNLALPGNVAAMTTGYPIVYGAHDDSMAIQSWVNQITNGGGKFYAPPGMYLILNPPTNVVNSQIMVPTCPYTAGNNTTYFEMYGSLGCSPSYASGTPRVAFDPNTTVFVPNIGTSANPGKWQQGMPSSFLEFRTVGTSTPYGTQLGVVKLIASSFYITNTLTFPILHDFIVQGSYDPSAIMIDELGAQEGRGPKNVIIGTWFLNTYCPLPSNTNGFGFVGPCNYSGQAGDCSPVSGASQACA